MDCLVFVWVDLFWVWYGLCFGWVLVVLVVLSVFVFACYFDCFVFGVCLAIFFSFCCGYVVTCVGCGFVAPGFGVLMLFMICVGVGVSVDFGDGVLGGFGVLGVS